MRSHFSNLAAASVIVLTLFFVWTTFRSEQGHQIREGIKAHSASLLEQQRLAAAQSQFSTAEDADNQLNTQPVRPDVSAVNDDGYAYGFYATNDQYACSVLVNIHRLRGELQSQIAIHVISSSQVSQAYITAFEDSGATVHIEQPPPLPPGAGSYYIDCLLKLLAFKLHRLSPGLKRVLALDSDQLIMQNMDHLFAGLPEIDLAAPRAYWIAKDFLASTFLMISLSDRLWESVNEALGSIGYGKFDMDIVNDLLGDQVMMLSGEYCCLNSHWEDWNLPKWYHPTVDLNMSTIEKVNALARPKPLTFDISSLEKRQDDSQRLHDSKSALNASSRANTTIPQTDQGAARLPVQDFGGNSVARPRFPIEHPLSKELGLLQESAAVIHFSAVGKPWTVTESTIRALKSDAHPLLGAQFQVWHDIAKGVCPGFTDGGLLPFKD